MKHLIGIFSLVLKFKMAMRICSKSSVLFCRGGQSLKSGVWGGFGFARNSSQLLNKNMVSGMEMGSIRCLSTTEMRPVKEIHVKEEGEKIVIEGKYVPSPREKYLAKLPSINDTNCNQCPLCKLGLQVRHTDVLIINQFINSKGKQLPRSITGLCHHQHKTMKYLIVMAEKAGLIDRDVTREIVHLGVTLYKPEEWEDPHFHKYYEEDVIKEFLFSKRKRH